MALLARFMSFKFIELSPPLTSSTVLLSPNQQHSLLSFVFNPWNTCFLVALLFVATLTSTTSHL
jgi:hypothetical protein